MNAQPAAVDATALDVIEEEARAVAQFFGIKQCDVAAQMLAKRVAERLGGRIVWVPGARGRASRDRDERIRSKFTGDNLAELSRDEGLSERQVRRIIGAR